MALTALSGEPPLTCRCVGPAARDAHHALHLVLLLLPPIRVLGVLALAAACLLAACTPSGGGGDGGVPLGDGSVPLDDGGVPLDDGGIPLGDPHSGQYHLGPVEWTGSFWNACAPYPGEIQSLEGQLLAGLSNEVASTGNACDACLQLTTGRGKTLIVRAITYGVANAAGDVDLSQAAFTAIHQGEYPRAMTWQYVTCPGTSPLYVQFQTLANPDWTSLWVRNPRIPIERVEVKSARHASFTAMQRGTDGTFTDAGGFGSGAFTLRVVGINGSWVEQSFPGFSGGALLTGTANLP